MTKKPHFFAALALTLGAATAHAAPIALSFGANGDVAFQRQGIQFGAIHDQYSFQLLADGSFGLRLQTGGKNANDVVFSQVYLTQGSKRIDLQAPNPAGFEVWELPSQILSAGEWVLHIDGQDTIHKSAGAYRFSAQNHVPAPATLALAGLGLVAAGWVRRKQRNTVR